jgi:hypothetical protein
MVLSQAQILQIFLALLTPAERGQAVAYLAEQPIVAGTVIAAGPEQFAAPWDAMVGFIDQDPRANWSHACRYIFINAANGETQSKPGRFPAFSKVAPGHWRLVYKAPAVPDSFVLAAPAERDSGQ